MLAACYVSAFPLEELFCDKARLRRRMYTVAFNRTELAWMNTTWSHEDMIPPSMLLDYGPQFIKSNVSSSSPNDTDAAQGLYFHTLTAEPPRLSEIDDLRARFSLLECWDAHQRSGWSPSEWKCAGVNMWLYGTSK